MEHDERAAVVDGEGHFRPEREAVLEIEERRKEQILAEEKQHVREQFIVLQIT